MNGEYKKIMEINCCSIPLKKCWGSEYKVVKQLVFSGFWEAELYRGTNSFLLETNGQF